MTVQGISCLFCRAELEIPEEPKNYKRKARILNQIHKRLCSALKLNFPKEFRKWNFSNEPFPFCLSCQKVILRLVRLVDQSKALDLEISRCVSTLSMLTIISKYNSEESQIAAHHEDFSGYEEGGNMKFLEKKYKYFRNVIIQRFNTKVRIKRCDQNRHFLKAKTASPNADVEPNAAEEVNSDRQHHNDITNDNHSEVEGDIICFECSPVRPVPGSPPENVTWDSCTSPVESDQVQEPPNSDSPKIPTSPSRSSTLKTFIPQNPISIPMGWDTSEIANNSISKVPSTTNEINVKSGECATEINATQESQQQQRGHEEEIPDTCELDIKIRPVADPSGYSEKAIAPHRRDSGICATTEEYQSKKKVRIKMRRLLSRNTMSLGQVKKLQARTSSEFHLHAGVRVLIYGTKAICLECRLTFGNNGSQSAWDQAKEHINQEHGKRELLFVCPLGDGLFHLNGFGFKELDNVYECSTCKQTFQFPPGWPEKCSKWRNIQHHIKKMHIRPAERAKEANAAQELPQQQSAPEKEIAVTCDLDIKDRLLPDPSGHLAQTSAILNKNQQACASTLENQKGTKAGQESEKFIDEQQVRKNILYKVTRLGGGLYELNGFGFKELDNCYECSTCKQTAPFAPGWPKLDAKWRNIKRHIGKMHISKQHPSSSSKLETDKTGEGTEVPEAAAAQKDDELVTKPSLDPEPRTVDGPVVKPLESSVILSHAGFKISVLREKALCLACGLEFKSSAKESSMVQVRKHITKEHELSKKTKQFVETIDKERKTFRVMGHYFHELESGYECSTCKKIFHFPPLGTRVTKWKNIRRHIVKFHGQSKGHVRCEICSAEVKYLPQHMKFVHCDESDRKVCEVCGKEFKSLLHLTSHKRIAHRSSQRLERRFQCDDCGNKFKTKASLIGHQRIHAGDKPYVCEHCGKTFRFSEVLKTHVASAHGERKFACDQCDWKFGANFLLTRHVKQVHQGIKPPPPKKRKKVQELREESEEETSEESDSDTSSADEEEA